MLKTKSFYRKTKVGGVRKIVREHYLRDDIPCNIDGCISCDKCSDFKPILCLGKESKPESASTLHAEILVLSTDVILHQVDLIQDDAFLNCIVLQTVLEEVKRRNSAAYKKVVDLIRNTDRHFLLFLNEFHIDTYEDKIPSEGGSERNERAVRTAIAWLQGHCREYVTGAEEATFVLLTDDTKLTERAVLDEITCRTTKDLVASMSEAHPHLVDKLALITDENASAERKGRLQFPAHVPLDELSKGLRSGQYLMGKFQSSRENYLEGSVFVETREQPVFIQGLMNLNRAVQDDTIAIEMLPESEWSAPAAILKTLDVDEKVDHAQPDEEIEATEDAELQSCVPKRTLETEKLPTGRVVGIVKRSWRPYCGMLQSSVDKTGTRQIFVPAEKRVPKIVIETRQAALLSGQRIVVQIDSWPRHSRYPQGHFVRALGNVGDKDTENEVLFLEHDIPHHSFSDAVLECLPKMPWIITDDDEEARTDLRHLDICSVDPPGCTDIDDALHCFELPDGNIEAGVHIADVSHFVRPATAIDVEAADRGTTVYLVDQRIDMLPDLLSSNLCSLRGGVERFAFSCIWNLTKDAEILSTRFCKSIISSNAALTYAEAQCKIDDSTQTDAVSKSLRLLNALAKKLKAKRNSGGALTLASLEIRFNLDSETHDPIAVQSKKSLETTSMVEEFMLLANISVAKRIFEEFPDCSLLRRHPVPPPSNYEPIVKAAAMRGFKLTIDSGKALSESLAKCVIPGNPYFNTMLRILCCRCMTQAVYFISGTIEQSLFVHFGLASPIYTHFTSPIRRYSDLVVHRLLAAAIGADKTYPNLLDKKKGSKVCQNLNYRHKMAQLAGRASVLLNTHLFFKDRIEILEGYITSVRKNAFQVLIPKYGLESAVLLGHNSTVFSFDETDAVLTAGSVQLRVFDPVTVRISVDSTNPQHPKLKLELVKPVVEGFSVETILDTTTPDEVPAKKQKTKD